MLVPELQSESAVADDPETQITKYIQEHGSISNPEVCQLLNVSKWKAYRLLKAMVESGELESEGKGRAIKYLLRS